MEQVYTPKQNYKVLVCTITYNQAKYITDTLDGVAMQQTNFPFVHYVIDDCSTDGEQEVIKTWLTEHCDMDKAGYIDLELANVILVHHKTNSYLTYAIYLLKRNLYKDRALKDTLVKPWRDHCEYEALCEGDDYWINPQKLQRQVDLLDKETGLGMCYGNYSTYIQSTGQFQPLKQNIEKCSFDELLLENCIGTLTTMVRTSLHEKYSNEIPYGDRVNWKMGDYPIWLWFAANSRIGYIPEDFAVYRVLDNSASHSPNQRIKYGFALNAFDISLYFSKRYGYEKISETISEEQNRLQALIALMDWNLLKFIKYRKLSSRITTDDILNTVKGNIKRLIKL